MREVKLDPKNFQGVNLSKLQELTIQLGNNFCQPLLEQSYNKTGCSQIADHVEETDEQ